LRDAPECGASAGEEQVLGRSHDVHAVAPMQLV